jgi:hypothetical protein
MHGWRVADEALGPLDDRRPQPSALAEDGDVAGVTTEGRRVVTDPLERASEVERAEVA